MAEKGRGIEVEVNGEKYRCYVWREGALLWGQIIHDDCDPTVHLYADNIEQLKLKLRMQIRTQLNL